MAKTWGRDAGVVIPQQNIHAQSLTQLHKLGERLVLGERVFHYAEAGSTALIPGVLQQSPVPVADHTGLAVTTVVAGLSQVTLTNGNTTALVKNDHADGYLWADTGICVGHTYKIKSHPAALVDATCVFTLYDELVETLTNAQETISLVKCPYKELIVSPSVATAHVAGVAPIDVTGDYFFWLQTWGPCSVLTEGNVLISDHVAVGDGSVDGTVQAADTDTEVIVGDVLRVESDTEYSLIYLKIAP